LTETVHARVRPAGAGRGYWNAGDTGQRRLERLLRRLDSEMRLSLPAAKMRTGILNSRRDSLPYRQALIGKLQSLSDPQASAAVHALQLVAINFPTL